VGAPRALTPVQCARLMRKALPLPTRTPPALPFSLPLPLCGCPWGQGSREQAAGPGPGPVARIVVQPCSKRVHTDAQYQDVGCDVAEDLSACGLILGVKQPQVCPTAAVPGMPHCRSPGYAPLLAGPS